MEDAHFFQELEQGVFLGVLDGHGGQQVAQFASKECQRRFPELLAQTGGNVRQTLELLIDEVHKKVAAHAEWNEVGSTAVLCYIDKQTHLVYTATVADSEANIYRNIEGQVKSILFRACATGLVKKMPKGLLSPWKTRGSPWTGQMH